MTADEQAALSFRYVPRSFALAFLPSGRIALLDGRATREVLSIHDSGAAALAALEADFRHALTRVEAEAERQRSAKRVPELKLNLF